MFDNYYDLVEYKEAVGKNEFGNIEYHQPEMRYTRYVKGLDVISVEGEKTIVRYKRVYHCPFEVKEGDKIDNHLVTDVRPSRDISGHIHFWIVGTV